MREKKNQREYIQEIPIHKRIKTLYIVIRIIFFVHIIIKSLKFLRRVHDYFDLCLIYAAIMCHSDHNLTRSYVRTYVFFHINVLSYY